MGLEPISSDRAVEEAEAIISANGGKVPDAVPGPAVDEVLTDEFGSDTLYELPKDLYKQMREGARAQIARRLADAHNSRQFAVSVERLFTVRGATEADARARLRDRLRDGVVLDDSHVAVVEELD